MSRAEEEWKKRILITLQSVPWYLGEQEITEKVWEALRPLALAQLEPVKAHVALTDQLAAAQKVIAEKDREIKRIRAEHIKAPILRTLLMSMIGSLKKEHPETKIEMKAVIDGLLYIVGQAERIAGETEMQQSQAEGDGPGERGDSPPKFRPRG